MIRQSHAEWLQEAERRFIKPGQKDRGDIAFQCPQCNRIQTIRDFKERGIDPNMAYQECLGRHDKSIGCNWAAYGLLGTLGLGRVVVTDDGKEFEVFNFAHSEEDGNQTGGSLT